MTSAALACGDMMARRRMAAGVARGDRNNWKNQEAVQ
jgi:acetaldehyde dehydrogenase